MRSKLVVPLGNIYFEVQGIIVDGFDVAGKPGLQGRKNWLKIVQNAGDLWTRFLTKVHHISKEWISMIVAPL